MGESKGESEGEGEGESESESSPFNPVASLGFFWKVCPCFEKGVSTLVDGSPSILSSASVPSEATSLASVV